MKRISLNGLCWGVMGALAVTAALRLTSRAADTASAPEMKLENTPVNRNARPITSFAPVIKKVAPSVVNIYSSRVVRERPFHHPFEDDPAFRQFFGDNDNRSRLHRAEWLGSGVIISPNGYILTASHVVAGASDVKVSIPGIKKEYAAKVIGKDPPTDVAVLKIDAKDLPAITLGDSDQLEVGDVVLAIGDPFEVGQTVTMGIVSALGRGGLGINAYEDFIQTDAAINPGNSGGALVDAEGRLIGISTAIMGSFTGGNQGVGFAVPVNMARRIMERLIDGGKITRGYLGVLPQDITPGLAEEFKLPDQNGALVGDVMPDTPAKKAGIESGDVVVGFNGKQVADANGLRLLVSESTPGTKAAVKMVRNGREKTISVTLAELPRPAQYGYGNESHDSGAAAGATDALDGVTMADIDGRARRQLGIPATLQGALVTEVDSESNAADAGLEQGDVIVQVEHQPVRDAADAVKRCTAAKGNRILLQVWHRTGALGATRYLSIDNTPPK